MIKYNPHACHQEIYRILKIKNSENENEKSLIAGWGKTELNSFPELLQNLAVNIDSKRCDEIYDYKDVSKPFKGDSKVCLGKYYYYYYYY